MKLSYEKKEKSSPTGLRASIKKIETELSQKKDMRPSTGLDRLSSDDFSDLIITIDDGSDLPERSVLTFEDIKQSYEIMKMTQVSRKTLPSANTVATYEASLKALRNHDSLTADAVTGSLGSASSGSSLPPSPFRGFEMAKDGFSKSTFYVRRSALIQHALDIIHRHTQTLLMMMVQKRNQSALDELQKALKDMDGPDSIQRDHEGRMGHLGATDLIQLTPEQVYSYHEAVAFLQANKPAKGTQEDRIQRLHEGQERTRLARRDRDTLGVDTPKRTKSSKKATLRKIMDSERKNPERGHFRDRMFTHLESQLDGPASPEQEDRLSALAIMTLAGPRPNEMLRGVRLHYIGPCQNYTSGRILIKLEGSKLSTFDDQELGHDEKAFTQEQKDLWDEIKSDASSRDFYRKGQDFRYVEVDVSLPQALYLYDLIKRKSPGKDTLPAPEAHLLNQSTKTGKIRDINSQIKASLSLHFPTFLHPSERDDPQAIRRGVDKLSKAVQRLGTQVYNGKDRITPYVFRHAFSADIKAHYEGEDLMISAGLGHSVDRTKGAYAPRGSSPKHRKSYIINSYSSKPVAAKLSRSYSTIAPR